MKESDNSQEITIKIQTLDNSFSLKINQSLTIIQLKEEISKKYNIPKDKQRLIFQGKFLKDNETLSFYKITDGCVIQLIAKSLEIKNPNQNSSQRSNNSNRNANNQRANEVYPIIQIPFRTNRRRRRLSLPHFDITEYIEGFYQNLISLDNYNNTKKKFDPKASNNIIEVFDFNKSSYEVGEWVDVKDTINQWLEAQVMKVKNNKAYVHYNGWGIRWDEWIDFNSPRMRNFKTYTLQSPLTFCNVPYPAIPCDSNIEPQQRPIDIFFYLEKTKEHMESLMEEINHLLNLRKNNTSIFKDNKFSIDYYEILFKATQMIPFLDRVGRMLSDISLVFSHFTVNPNYYSSFMFGYKRQDLFNEIYNMKGNNKDKKDNIIFDEKEKNDKDKEIKVIKTKNEDSQTPPIENKFMKQFKEQQQLQNKEKEKEKEKELDKSKEENKIIIEKDEKKQEINKDENIKDNNIINIKKDESEDKKETQHQKEKNEIMDYSDKNKDKEKEKDKFNKSNDDKKDTKTTNEIIRENINEETHTSYQRHNSVPSISESSESTNTANFQRQRQRQRQEEEEEILPNQIVTNLGYDLSFSSPDLPFIQRIIYSYTLSDRIMSPFSPFYQIFSNKKLFPRVNLQVPNILSSGEVMMMTGYSPFSEPNYDIYIHTIAVNPNNNNNNESNSSNNNNNSNNNSSNSGNNNANNNNNSSNNQNNT